MSDWMDELRRRQMGIGAGLADPEEEADAQDEEESSPESDDEEETNARPFDPLVGQNVSTEPADTTPHYGPETSAYLAQVGKIPQKEDYKPSGLRKGLAAVAGIGSGIAYGPERGAAAAHAVEDEPFNSALGAYQRNTGAAQIGAGIESGTMSAQAKMREEEAQRQAELARRTAEESRGRRYDWMTGPIAQQYKLEQLKVQHPNAPNKLVPIGAHGLYNPETKEVIGQDTSEKYPGALGEDIRAHQIVSEAAADPTKHDPAIVEGAKAFMKAREEGKDPTSAFASVVKAKETELGRKLNSREMVAVQNSLSPASQGPIMVGPDNKVMRATPGGTLPEGSMSPTQMGSETVSANKQTQKEQEQIKDNQKSYALAQRLANDKSATSDAALVMQFMGMMKPESMGKMRFQKNEQDFILGTRNSLGDLEALYQKVAEGGQKLVPEQRKAMLDTMRIMAFPVAAGGAGNVSNPTPPSVPKVGEQFNGSKVKSVKQIK